MASPGKAQCSVCSAPVLGEMSRVPLLEVPTSWHLGPGQGLDSLRELAHTETALTHPGLAGSQE